LKVYIRLEAYSTPTKDFEAPEPIPNIFIIVLLALKRVSTAYYKLSEY
jgi:hypothetical protein